MKVCDLIGEFIDLGISGKIKKKDGNEYTKTTLIKGYGNLQKHICSYEKENGSIKANKVDYKLYQDLLHYFDEVELEKASQCRLIKYYVKSFIFFICYFLRQAKTGTDLKLLQ